MIGAWPCFIDYPVLSYQSTDEPASPIRFPLSLLSPIPDLMTWSHTDGGRFVLDPFMLWYHSMTLREVTRAVISLVEKASGCQVIVSEDSSLKTLAAARIACGAN